jgi:predicted small metal-binding protein
MILRVNGRDGLGTGTLAREQRRQRMTKVVRCACGLDLRDADERRLIGRVQQHAKEAHDLDLNDEQVRAMMEIEQE